MPAEFPYDVFLSHSAKDKAAVRAVAKRFDVLEKSAAISNRTAQFWWQLQSLRQIVSSLVVGIWLAAAMLDVSAQTDQVSLTLDQETKKMLREATEERWFKKDSFVSALLGGALALAGGLVASWMRIGSKPNTRNKRMQNSERMF